MSYNGSGTFQINTSGQPVVTGTVISSTAFNALTADLATGLSTAITKDGQTATTVRIPFAAGISSTLVTDSSSVSTGSIITAGGVGVAKNLYVGVNANVAGTLGVTGVATFSAAPIYSSLTASSAVATDASKALVSVTNTGTGNNVLATSPTITTPTISQLSSAAATALTLQSAGTTAITVDTSQLVGIGTTSPSSYGGALVVRKANTGQGVTSATAQFSDGTNSALWIGHTSGAANLVADQAITFGYTNGTTTTENARITTGGNLLVGTTSNIAANAKIFALGSGVGIAVGYATTSTAYRHLYMNNADATLYFFNPTNYASLSPAGAWVNASDARLKKNIVDIKYGLADVLKAQPRSYQMNDVAGDFVGFVAQELQTVIPEVVTGDPEKQLGVDYGSLVAVAFKAIQEQQALIQSLTTRIAALEAK